MDVPDAEPKLIDTSQAPRLKKRINIYIERSDGRIHEASVSDIDYEKQNVIVEWIENGETKGKSVDFPMVFQLNPSLVNGSFRNLDRETENGNEDSPVDEEVDVFSDEDDMLMVNVPVSDDVLYEEPEDDVVVSKRNSGGKSSTWVWAGGPCWC